MALPRHAKVHKEVKVLNKYELLYVIDSAMEDQARTDLIAQFQTLMTNNGATVDKVEEWGKRRLAYPINFKNEGYYVLVQFTAAPEFPRELERNLQINENVMRYLVTLIDE